MRYCTQCGKREDSWIHAITHPSVRGNEYTHEFQASEPEEQDEPYTPDPLELIVVRPFVHPNGGYDSGRGHG